jgi:transposase
MSEAEVGFVPRPPILAASKDVAPSAFEALRQHSACSFVNILDQLQRVRSARFSRVFQGSTESTIFEEFIEQLLQHCDRWPEPKSVLVMDNASFHHSEGVKELCLCAGVKLVFLPPYSPDLNSIEEFVGDLKRFIRWNLMEYESNPAQDFAAFLKWCISVAGGRVDNARAHFRHAGVTVKTV